MGLASDFGLLFLLEARDKASETFAKVDEALSKFTGTAAKAGKAAKAAGEEIDSSLLETASGADALEVANARVEAAQAKAAGAAREQANAERELLAAHQAAVGAADGDSAASDRLAAADAKLAAAQRDSAAAAKQLSDAQRLQSDTADAAAAKDDEAAAAQKKSADAADASSSRLGGVTKAAGLLSLGMMAAGYEAVKMAGNFQDSTTHLVTDAGESAKKLGMVQAGILQVSSATGTAASDVTNAMYHIESGGFHAKQGLALLTIATQGAKVGGADLDTVSKTLVGTMNAYGMKSKDAGVQTHLAAQMMNELIATTGAGDMKMQDLASSLSSVAPLAAAAHIKFSQVGGAIATMTGQGMSADQATQDLANTIRSLSNPNNVAINEMNQLGVNAQDVSKNLGTRGLTGTISYLTQAITSHMGKSGQVLMSAFNQSTTAGQALQKMLGTMPAPLKSLAESYMKGSISAKQWRTDLQQQTPVNQALMTQFGTLYNKSNSFNDLLAKGGPTAQTYTSALSKMMGGATGLNTALMLSGKNMSVFTLNTDTIQKAADKSGTSVDNWSTIQGTFNQKLASAKTAVENTGIALGSALLPAVTAMLQKITSVLVPIATWIAKHKTLTEVIFGVVGGIAALVAIVGMLHKAYSAVTGAISTVKSGLQAIGLFSKKAAASQDEAAGSADGLAASTEGLSAAEDENVAATEASTAAADENGASWLATGLKAMGAGIKFVALKVAQVAGTVVTWAATAATMAFGAAIEFATSPIGLIIIAIVALVAIFVVLWKKCAWFRDFWKGLWKDIEVAAKFVWAGLKAAFHAFVQSWVDQFKIAKAVALDLWHGVIGAFDAIKNGVVRIVSDVVGWVKTHWQLLVAIFTGPLGIITGLVIKFSSDLKKWLMDGVHGVEKAVSWFTSLPGKFFGWMKDIGTDVLKGIDTVVHFFTQLPGRIVTGLGNMASLLIQKGKDVINGLWSGVKYVWNGDVAFFTNMGHTIMGWLSDAGNWLYDIGKNIISGLWNGISSAVGGLMSNISGLGGDIVSGFKSVLSIFSPSRVMADQVGKYIPAGIAVGITDNMGVIAAAAKRAGQVTVSAAHTIVAGAPGLSMPSIPATSSAAGSGAGSVYVDLRGAYVPNGQTARKLANDVGAAVAKHLFPQAGYKLQTM